MFVSALASWSSHKTIFSLISCWMQLLSKTSLLFKSNKKIFKRWLHCLNKYLLIKQNILPVYWTNMTQHSSLGLGVEKSLAHDLNLHDYGNNLCLTGIGKKTLSKFVSKSTWIYADFKWNWLRNQHWYASNIMESFVRIQVRKTNVNLIRCGKLDTWDLVWILYFDLKEHSTILSYKY